MKAIESTEMKITYPRELQITLKKSGEDFARQFKLAAAIELFREKNLSLGKAAKLAEMNRQEFIQELGKRKVSIFKTDEDELREDIANA